LSCGRGESPRTIYPKKDAASTEEKINTKDRDDRQTDRNRQIHRDRETKKETKSGRQK